MEQGPVTSALSGRRTYRETERSGAGGKKQHFGIKHRRKVTLTPCRSLDHTLLDTTLITLMFIGVLLGFISRPGMELIIYSDYCFPVIKERCRGV